MSPVVLRRIDDTRHMRRFYRLDVQPDLFGGVAAAVACGMMGMCVYYAHWPSQLRT